MDPKEGGIALIGLSWLRTGISVNTANNYQVPENEKNMWPKELLAFQCSYFSLVYFSIVLFS
jgi:hypothetical protein